MISTKVTFALLLAMLSFGMCLSQDANIDPAVAEDEQTIDDLAEPAMIVQDQETGDDFEVEAQVVSYYTLRLNSGQRDYASLSGRYSRLVQGKIRNKPIYRNAAKKRVMFHTGSRWVITSDANIFTILNGGTGGFFSSKPTNGGVNSLTRDKCNRLVSIWKPRYN